MLSIAQVLATPIAFNQFISLLTKMEALLVLLLGNSHTDIRFFATVMLNIL